MFHNADSGVQLTAKQLDGSLRLELSNVVVP